MTEPLVLKYRPQTFSDVIGQRIHALSLDRMVAQDDVPDGLLFVGPKGSGKTSMARILAKEMQAELIEVDAASHGLVADVRQMIESIRYGGKRVIVYDEAHSMTKEAFNALLKVLEEPPAGTIFVLVTTEPDKILPTVKSRLMEYSFQKITPAVLMDRLVHISEAESIEAEPELLTYLAERADGSARDAIMALDQCWRAGITDKATFLEMAGEEDVAPDLVLAMLSGDHAHVFQVADDLSQRVPDAQRLASLVVGVLKDVLVMKSGGTVSASETQLAKRKTIALHLEAERIVAGMKMLWDLRTRVRSSADPKGNLDLALVLITDIFTQGRQVLPKVTAPAQPVKPPVAAVPSENSRKLTLAEL